MFRRLLGLTLVVVTALPLMAFRMPAESQPHEKLLYDVRGAFVTARPDVPQALVIATDMLVDEAIRTTVRSTTLPRTIISVRIEHATRMPLLIGSRHEAKVSVKAISVASGDPVAEGSFKASVFLLDPNDAAPQLAGEIADRIAGEFRLENGRRTVIASALFP